MAALPTNPPPTGTAPGRGAPAPGTRLLVALFLAALTVAGVALYAARARHPGPDAGEFWSDSNIINASRGFDQVGFTATWGLPRIQLAAPVDDTSALYLSYPPGPYWLSYGAWRIGRALGVDPVLAARLFAQTCGLASALLAFLVFTRLARSAAVGALSGLFYVLSPAFLCYSAALHHMAYSPMLLMGAMLAWLAFEDGRSARRWAWLGLAAALFAADCWTNLEHMFFYALFVGARTAFHFRWPVVLGAALVGPIPIPMMALRVLHNAQVLGGWDAAMAKFTSSASRRSAGGRAGVDLYDLAASWAARLDFPIAATAERNMVWNQEYVFPAANPWVLGAIAVALVSVAAHRVFRARAPRGLALSLVDPGQATLPLPVTARAACGPRFLVWNLRTPGPLVCGLVGGLLLLACGFTWFVVMTQHTQPHRFIVLLLMPGLSLLLGTLSWGVIASARSATREAAGLGAWWVQARAWILALALIGVFASQVRRADVLNELAELDTATHRRVTGRIEANERAARLGSALGAAGVERVHMFDGANMMPWRAATIGLPFLYARKEMPSEVGPADAVYAEAWDGTEIAACLDAVERLGLPDLVAPPGDRVLVFRGSRPEGGADVRLGTTILPATVGGASEEAGTGLVLGSMRWGPTLLGDQSALTLWVTGDLSPGQPEAVLNRFVFTLRIRDAAGRIVREERTRLRWAPIRDDRRAIVVLVAPEESVRGGGTAELAVWDRRERRAVAFSDEAAPGLQRVSGGRAVRWPLAGSSPD